MGASGAEPAADLAEQFECVHPDRLGRFTDFCEWSRWHLWSGDYDPIYPWLKQVFTFQDLTERERLWRLYLYVAFYHLGSCLTLWRHDGYDEPTVIPEADLALPTGTERRCFRGQPAPAHTNIKQAVETGALEPSLWNTLSGERGWDEARDQFESIPWNGPWASYKWADLLAHVMDYDITASDLGVGGNSKTAGPIPGMVKVTGADWKRCANDVSFQKELLAATRSQGVPFTGLDQLETCLCDYNSAIKGHYYVGHDIDLYGSQLDFAPPVYWEARQETFPHLFLGERHGWEGVREDLQTLYRDHGVIRWWEHQEHEPTLPEEAPT